VSAVLNDAGEILLGQRSDNRRWSIIAGMIEPGEQPADAILREIREETGVRAEIDRLAGVALNEHTYPNGDVCQFVNVWFRCRTVGGEARVNDDESVAVGWFSARCAAGAEPVRSAPDPYGHRRRHAGMVCAGRGSVP
jgi:8-oxo-dGTP pyrophosphatase MutT (NUDIX family)